MKTNNNTTTKQNTHKEDEGKEYKRAQEKQGQGK
jgi:hypothetical protein